MDKKIELLAPAGNPEKLEIAVHFGADAVYLAGKDFSLRNFSGNFTLEELEKGVSFAHENNVKVYVALNVYSRNDEYDAICDYLKKLAAIGPDALIIADPGVFAAAREIAPDVEIHVSTQANTTSWAAARFWKDQGASRIIAARELPLEDIRGIGEKSGIEVETFVHGAMCISYSGRCLLSSFLTNRDSNRGQCSHPCRWKYNVVEETRPGQYFPLCEDERGAYIFNSKDLCMIGHIPELADAGIVSLKIEGRMKGINYLASVVKTYREAIDAYYENPGSYKVDPAWVEELSRINSRQYCTGFYFGYEGETAPNYEGSWPGTIHRFGGKILSMQGEKALVEVRNKISAGGEIEVLTRKGPPVLEKIEAISDLNGNILDCAQPNSRALLALSGTYSPNDLIRIAEESTYG